MEEGGAAAAGGTRSARPSRSTRPARCAPRARRRRAPLRAWHRQAAPVALSQSRAARPATPSTVRAASCCLARLAACGAARPRRATCPAPRPARGTPPAPSRCHEARPLCGRARPPGDVRRSSAPAATTRPLRVESPPAPRRPVAAPLGASAAGCGTRGAAQVRVSSTPCRAGTARAPRRSGRTRPGRGPPETAAP